MMLRQGSGKLRRVEDGLWDRGASHGEITGSGPGFDEAMRKFRKRQEEAGKVGRWRHEKSAEKINDGTYIDRDWDIIDY